MADKFIRWTPNTEGDIASYNLFRNGVKIASIPKAFVQPYKDTVTVDGDYIYFLTAVDTAGNESAHSASVTATVNANPPQAPVGLTVADV